MVEVYYSEEFTKFFSITRQRIVHNVFNSIRKGSNSAGMSRVLVSFGLGLREARGSGLCRSGEGAGQVGR